jgi:hypothetical protein
MWSSTGGPFVVLVFLFFTANGLSLQNAHPTQQAAAPSHQSSSIACRVMERHADKEHSTVLILFHQRDKPDQPKLKEFLLQHDGGTIQIQIGAGEWQKATVWRIRNCFGRGLLVLPDTAAPKDRATFTIRAVQ